MSDTTTLHTETSDVDSDADLAREQIEIVFALGGGELESAPWEGVGAFWYEGPPEYAASDFADRWEREYRTAIVYCLFSAPPCPEGWEIVGSYASSGESECHCLMAEGTPEAECPVCEGGGYVYLGDGWAEVVYRARHCVDTYSVCVDCYLLEATGDPSHFDGAYTGEDADRRLEECSEGMDRILEFYSPDRDAYLATGDDLDEFASTPCECCGSRLAGSRHALLVLSRAPESEAS